VSLLADDTAPSLQAGAAYVLGTAVSNNEKLAAVLVQEHPGLLQQLLTVGGRRMHSRLLLRQPATMHELDCAMSC
jgi:hypothetical protein